MLKDTEDALLRPTPEMQKTPRQARSKVLVDAVLQAAVKLMEVLPLRKITTNRIAEKAGVGVASVHEYFGNKETIFSQVVERLRDAHRKRIEEKIEELRGLPFEDFIDGILDEAVRIFVERPTLLKFALSLEHQMHSFTDIVSPRNQVASHLARVLAQDYAENLRGRVPSEVAKLIVEAVVGNLRTYAMESPRIEPDRLRSNIGELTWRFLS